MTEATCNTHVTVTVDVTGDRPEYSIRSLMTTALLESSRNPDRAEALKVECREMVTELHPSSAACLKFGKHYAWYKATMKKAGQL